MITPNIEELAHKHPHSPFHLRRYLKFIEHCVMINQKEPVKHIYMEKHHILPKARDLFPEYTNLVLHPWNCAILTLRQHIIAHIMLDKAFRTLSTALAVPRTATGSRVTDTDRVNSRLIEAVRIAAKIRYKGIFWRGYNDDGTAKVSDATKQKLSELKKLQYSNPEARERQSLACRGIKRSAEARANISKAARLRPPRTAEQRENARVKALQVDRLCKLRRLYVTPFGVFSDILSNNLVRYAMRSNKVVNNHNIKGSSVLTKRVFGMTFKQLGFYVVEKSDPEFESTYALLDQVHLPESNHPLASELSDFLLREKLLH